MSQHAQAPAPLDQLLQMILASMVSRAIGATAELNVADHLAGGPKTADEIAAEIDVDPNALYRLMRAVASVGVLSEDEERRFHLTEMGTFLRSDVPSTMRDVAVYMNCDWHSHVWDGLVYSVTHRKPYFDELFGKPVFEFFPENPDKALVFNNAMTSLSSSVSEPIAGAYDFSGFERIADIGGGHGLLLSRILEKNPHMRGTLFDAPSVVDGAASVFAAHGVADRCEAVAGNFFESVPAGQDVYIMKHIIHDWEDEKAETILRHCVDGLNEGGRVLVVEMVVPEGNAPSPSKFLDLEMLLFLHSHERTEAEYGRLFERSGLRMTRVVPTASAYGIVEGVKA